MLCVLASLLIHSNLTTQGGGAADHFDRKVTIAQEYITLGEFCAFLTNASDTPIYAEPAIKEHKISVFCSNRPIKELMWAAEQLLQARWDRDNSSYVLDAKEDVKRDEKQTFDQERALAENAIASLLRSQPALTAAELNLSARMRRDPAIRMQVDSSDLYQGIKEKAELRHFLPKLDVAFSGHEQEVAHNLALGEPVYASTLPLSGSYLLPADLLGHESVIPPGSRYLGADHRTSISPFAAPRELLFGVRYDAACGTFETALSALDNQLMTVMNAPLSTNVVDYGPNSNLTTMKQRLAAWAQNLDPSVLTSKLTGAPLPATSHSITYHSASDYLQLLSTVTKTPIIADAFRRPCSSETVFEAKAVGDWVGSFNKDARMKPIDYQKGYVRTDKGWLMFRHARGWRLQITEPPEALIREMTEKEKKGLSMNDVAEFAGRLSPDQLNGFRSDWPIVADFPVTPLITSGGFYRLWSRLSVDQRRLAGSRRGLDVAVNQPSIQAWAELAADLLWRGHLSHQLLPLIWGAPPTEPVRFAIGASSGWGPPTPYAVDYVGRPYLSFMLGTPDASASVRAPVYNPK